MARTHTDLLAAWALALGPLAGCAFSDGDPWGEARFSVEVVLDDAGRATESGYRTSNDYAVQVDGFQLDLGTISLRVGAEGAATGFDPAAPPDGYSLCHNGHCHADDGRLVPYADIEREISGATAPVAVVTQALDARVDVTPTPTAAPLGACSDACRLPRGRLTTVSLSLHAAHVRVRVSDRRPEDRRRLPAEGVTYTLELPIDALGVDASVTGRIDGRRPPVFEVDARLIVPATLFDGVDWAEADDPAAALGLALAEHLDLAVDIRRSDF